jgi:hypothetical protein
MEIKTNIDQDKEMIDLEEEENVETNREADIEEELIYALSEINNLRKMNLKQKKQLQKYEEEDHDSKAKISQIPEESEKIIISLKFQLEEARRIKEVVRIHVTSHSTEHTFIEIFFEDTCVQVIWLWYIVILFRLWVIYDDDVVL